MPGMIDYARLPQQGYNGGTSSVVPIQPYSYVGNDLNPILQSMLNSVARQGDTQWQNMYRGITEGAMRNGMNSRSGLMNLGLLEGARQHALDIQGQQYGLAMQLYQQWLAKQEADRQFALAEQQRADAASQAKQQKKAGLWGTLGSIAGAVLGK